MWVARLRLFAHLREIAGAGVVEVDSGTVGGILDAAGERYGGDFVAALSTAKVWINGEPAERSDEVNTNDEVAVIPPVSGGEAALVENPTIAPLVLGVLVVLLVVTNWFLSAAWFAGAVVLALSVWAMDIVQETNVGGMTVQLPPVLVSILAGAVFAVSSPGDDRGFEAFGLVLVLSVIVSLVWSVAIEASRHLSSVASTTVLSSIAGLATASLVAARVFTGSQVSGIFLIQVGAAAILGVIAVRVAILDPNVVSSLGSIAVASFMAWIWGFSIVSFLLLGVVVALALLAGRGFGWLCRTGENYYIDRPPGWVSDLDGPVLAAAAMLPILYLVTSA